VKIVEKIEKFLSEEKEFFIKSIEIKGRTVKFVRVGKWGKASLSSNIRVYLDGKKFGDFKGSKIAMKQIEKEIG